MTQNDTSRVEERGYPIHESIDALRELEKRYRGERQWIRVRAFLLLKQHPQSTLREVARQIGCSERSMQRWWNLYKSNGLEAVLRHDNNRRGATRLAAEDLEALRWKITHDGFANLGEARDWIKQNLGVDYSISGVWNLLQNKLDEKVKRKRMWKLNAHGHSNGHGNGNGQSNMNEHNQGNSDGHERISTESLNDTYPSAPEPTRES